MKNKIMLEEMLRAMKQKRQQLEKELAEAPEGELLLVQKDGKPTMQQYKKNGEKAKRQSLMRKTELASALIRKRYAVAELKMLQEDISAMTKLLAQYQPLDFQSILDTLPQKYRTFSQAQYLGKDKSNMDAWMREPYKQSTYHPEQKVHVTSQGLYVRSKSEVLLAEKLHELGIPFRYEQVIKIGRFEVAPDFTCRPLLLPEKNLYLPDHAKQEEVYIEHCGLTGNAEYMKHHKWKMELYESAGIVPWKNLIVTYEDENGFINLAAVEAQLKAMLL